MKNTKSEGKLEGKEISQIKKKKPKKQSTTNVSPKAKSLKPVNKSTTPRQKPLRSNTTSSELSGKPKVKRKKPKPQSSKTTEDLKISKSEPEISEYDSGISVLPILESDEEKEVSIHKKKESIPKLKAAAKRKQSVLKPKSSIRKSKPSLKKPQSVIQKAEYIPKAEPNVPKIETSTYKPKSTAHKPLSSAQKPEPGNQKPTQPESEYTVPIKTDSTESASHRQNVHTGQTHLNYDQNDSLKSSRKDLENRYVKVSYFQERDHTDKNENLDKSYTENTQIKTFFWWLPVKYYELWIIFSITGFFSVWFVMLLLSMLYIIYGLTLCDSGFRLMFTQKTLEDWVHSINPTFIFDPLHPNNTFEFENYMIETLSKARKKFLRHGLLFIFMGIVQLLCHIHGCFSFYFRRGINLLLYSLALFGLFIILLIQGTYFSHLTDLTISRVFKSKMIDILNQKECHICVPPENSVTQSFHRLSETDFILKFQTCTLKCCGYSENENSLPLWGLFDSVPLVCCRDFHPLMFQNSTQINLPSQLRCINETKTSTTSLPPYRFPNQTCRIDQKITSCDKIIKNTFYYLSTLRFTEFVFIYMNILGFFYFLFAMICACYFAERFYTRRRILKDIHNKLVRYQTDSIHSH